MSLPTRNPKATADSAFSQYCLLCGPKESLGPYFCVTVPPTELPHWLGGTGFVQDPVRHPLKGVRKAKP